MKQATCKKTPRKIILEQINTFIQQTTALKQENSNLIWKTIGLDMKDCAV
jgi:ubiquinone biosynthesis protein UbiJ